MNLRLSVKERDLILRHAFPSPELDAKLRLGLRDGNLLSFKLEHDDVLNLAECVAAEASNAKDRKLRRQFERLSDRIETLIRKQGDPSNGTMSNLPRGIPHEFHAAVEKIISSREFASLEDVNAALSKLTTKLNRSPRREFQGLSPEQVMRLIGTEWNLPDAGLHLCEDLNFVELDRSEFFHNARVLLSTLQNEMGTKATGTGNFNRKFVQLMLDTMRWPDGYITEVWRFNKVLNEEDVRLFHVLRIVMGFAGLIRKHKSKFLITKKGASLLAENQASTLYAALFHSFFCKFHLAYVDRIEEYPGVQETIAFSLYVLSIKARKWTSLEKLVPLVFLPVVAAHFQSYEYLDTPNFLLRSRIISPLERFGLMQCKFDEDDGPFFARIKEVRLTPLYRKFLHFTLDP